MAAPTPVSALVHSSTLVTAGVYLVIRFGYMVASSEVRVWLFTLGALTIVMAGLAAMGEIDIKKIIALSTLRQLGVIILTLGAGSPKMAFFHLLAHAYFKAILFMCAGRLIHTISEYQDIRTMSGGELASVKVLAVAGVANLRLSGLPFITGFYSKDLILEAMLIQGHSILGLLLLALGTMLTVAYSVRMVILLSVGVAIGGHVNYTLDGDTWMVAGILILLLPRILAGCYMSSLLVAGSWGVILPFGWKLFIPTIIFLGVVGGLGSAGRQVRLGVSLP